MYRILIVDDERIERNGIRFLLKKLNMEFDIDEAVNGLDALEKIRQADYDILLTDVKMPFMDGIELIDNVVNEKKKMRCVIFSGCNEFDYAKRAIRLGVVDYILKPVDPKEFKETLEKVVDELEAAKASDELKSKSMEFLYEHALYMLVNGEDIDSIRKEYNGLELNFAKFRRILLVEFNHDFFGRRDVDFKKNEKITALGIERYLNLNQQQELIFLGGGVDVVQAAHELVKIIKSDYDEDCYIAVSSDIDRPEDMKQKVDELDELMDNKFYHPEIRVFYPNMESDSSGMIQFDDDTLMKQMKQDIKMKDITFLRIHFDALCKKYRGQSNFSHIYIKFVFSNLLKDFYDNIPGADEAEFGREIDRLYKSEDFSCIMDIVNNYIDLLEKSFGKEPATSHREIETVKNYIHNHYGEEIGAQQLADMVYLAPSYLSSLFKKETGQNLSKYIKQYRMEKAKELLTGTNMKIVNISEQVGYPNVSYFVQSFREYFGISPQKFRDQGELN